MVWVPLAPAETSVPLGLPSEVATVSTRTVADPAAITVPMRQRTFAIVPVAGAWQIIANFFVFESRMNVWNTILPPELIAGVGKRNPAVRSVKLIGVVLPPAATG